MSSGTKSAEESHSTKGLLRLTMACNERCPFCNVPVEDYPRPTPPAEQTAAELDAFVASGQRTLTISGGEPTLLRKRLLALVAQARGGGIPFVELQTNAVLIDDSYAAALALAGLTSAFVSLLSHDAALHDQLAGLGGAWPRCLQGVDALVAHGVRVTLNPVFARPTQGTVADYVDFVATRLPGVRSISLSAVQPHGRAAHDLDLLPDYAVLAGSVRQARARARAHDIELLNPYCGLPLCVGWEDDHSRSVEAIEAAAGGWQDRPGVENTGDKRHGAPCSGCALRTRCGGAWHAVWDERGGSGIEAPLVVVPPWDGDGPGQDVCRTAAQLAAARAPTVWVCRTGLAPGDLEGLLASRATDLALDLPGAALDPAGQPDRGLVKALRHLDRSNGLRQPQRRLRVWLRLMDVDPARVRGALTLATRLGVHAVALAGPVADHRGTFAALFPALFPGPG